MVDLTGRSVLVAGATGGLGSGISQELASRGARLTLVSRSGGPVATAGDAVVVAADLRRAVGAERAVRAAVSGYGGLDGVVFAAGAVAFGTVADTTDETLVELFTLNTLAPIRLLRAALPALRESADRNRDPFFCAISAVVAESPVAGMAGYSASKAALTAFDQAAGRELRRSGIRVVDVRPPHTETGLATRPLAGEAPRLPPGLPPDLVARRIVQAIESDERDLPSTSFG